MSPKLSPMKIHDLFDTTTPLPPHERYGEKPFLGSSHDWAIKTLHQLPKIGDLLDIGPGSGVIAKLLGSPSHIIAVEPDRSSWEHLRPLYATVHENVNDLAPEESFDSILLLDVLEHVSDPATLLASATQRLRPGGHLLISVPNIAHFAIRLMLLLGFFPEMNKGPLDRTHLKFFTLSTITNLIKNNSQIQIVSRTGSIPPLELLVPASLAQSKPWGWMQSAHHCLATKMPGLFAYQLLFLLQKSPRSV
jgi:SAM-dependent methyltransferase